MFSLTQTIVIILLTVTCFQPDLSILASRPSQQMNQVPKDIIIEGDEGVIKVNGKIISKNDNKFKQGHVHVRTSKGLVCINKKRIFDMTATSSKSFALLQLDSISVTYFKIKVNKNGEFEYADDQGKIVFAQSAKISKNQKDFLKDVLVGVDEYTDSQAKESYQSNNIENTVIKGEGGQIKVNGKLVVERDYQFENGILHLNIFNGVVRINGKEIFGKHITCPGKCPSMEVNFDEGVDSFEIKIMKDGRVEYKDNRLVSIGGRLF